MACESRLKKLKEDEKTPKIVYEIIKDYHHALKSEEKELLTRISEQLKKHPLWEWCQKVKGMGAVACLTFLGFINPYKADTAGKAKAYLGIIPTAGLRSGKKANFNPEAKGRIWLITRNVIMQKDDYYYPLYLKKKEYYLNTERKVLDHDKGEWITFPPFKEILKDPSKCPKYSQCIKELKRKAERLGREPKKPPCRLHLDQMAKRWLMGILVSHATELMREALGLDTTNFKAHHDYIPPKP